MHIAVPTRQQWASKS